MKIKLRNLQEPYNNNNETSTYFSYTSPRKYINSKYSIASPTSIMNKKEEKYFLHQSRLHSETDLQV